MLRLANCLNDGYDVKYIRHIDGTCYIVDAKEELYDPYVEIASFKDVFKDKVEYAKAFKTQYEGSRSYNGNYGCTTAC